MDPILDWETVLETSIDTLPASPLQSKVMDESIDEHTKNPNRPSMETGNQR